MFYKIENTPTDAFNRDLYLINNFLKEIPKVVDEVAENLQDMAVDEIDKMNYFSLPDLINEHFKLLVNAQRQLKVEQVLDSKGIYIKMSDNGLTGESLSAKLQVLDWLWEKAQKLFIDLKEGEFHDLFSSLINQMKSILKSILSVLGIDSDIFEEDFDLLISVLEMCKQN